VIIKYSSSTISFIFHDYILSIHFLVENLFIKRRICLLCRHNMEKSIRLCVNCNTGGSKHFADVYDTDYVKVLSEIVERNISDIVQYRQQIMKGCNNENNDIPFQKIYRSLLKNVSGESFISLILHLDGIGLGKSNKLTLWILSCSITELPPHLRNKRENMVLLSAWIGYCEPIIDIWLCECIRGLKQLKSSGMWIKKRNR